MGKKIVSVLLFAAMVAAAGWMIGCGETVRGATTTTTTTTTTSTSTTGTVTTTTTSTTTTTGGGTHGLTNLFVLHHSVGDDIIVKGDVRGYINTYNATHATSFVFWDHGYAWDGSYWGLRNPAGDLEESDYGPLTDNTDPDGLLEIFTTDNITRTQIMANHQVIAFKSCFSAVQNLDPGVLSIYQGNYLAMRDYFDAHPEKLFVVITPPPLNPLDANSGNSDRARQFANWMKSTASGGFLEGSHPNIVCFDLFDLLANDDDSSPTANMLRAEYYEGDADYPDPDDSHPNPYADSVIAPIFAQFLIDAALGY